MQFGQLKRREFISLLGGVAATFPLVARAQQSTTPVIGFLGSASPDLWVGRLRAFRQGLSETGYVEGNNVVIDYRWAEGQHDRLPALAADLVRNRITVMATPDTPATLAAKAVTTTIPIVFFTAADPVEVGFVANLARPGGNLTGVAVLAVELGSKRLELLHELVPTATTIALLVNPTEPALSEPITRGLQTAARALGLKLHALQASTERDFDAAFATLIQLRADGLVIAPQSLFSTRSERLARLALHHTVPTIFQYQAFTAAGGLMSYGGSDTDAYRLAGIYTGRILKGEKPADLPVQQSTKVELIINLKTARALGLTVPISLLGRADEVIE
jgi:putative tryptophan/tyrosine transport system substrate-binding protein